MHVQESELFLGYYCKSQRDKTEQRMEKPFCTEGQLAAGHSPLEWDLFQIRLAKKKKYFEEQGGIELGYLINSFYFNYRETKSSLMFYRNEPEELL